MINVTLTPFIREDLKQGLTESMNTADAYDSLGRLKKWTKQYRRGSQPYQVTHRMEYDIHGNIKKKQGTHYGYDTTRPHAVKRTGSVLKKGVKRVE